MKKYEYSQFLMGTKVSLQLFNKQDAIAEKVFMTIKMLEDKLTVNREKSEVMSINQASGKHSVVVSPFVFSLIEQAKKISLDKDSCFNVAIGALVKLWKVGFEGENVPTDESIQQYLQLTDPNLIKLDKQNHSIFLTKKGMEIDLGAIAKGYVADVIKAQLNKENIYQAIINLGGNVFTIGESPLSNEGYWRVGLQKPFSENRQPLGIIKIKDRSVVTSGIYERFFIKNRHLYHHILNPKTGYPLDNELESVTIITNSSLEGDIYSTYLYGLGVEKGKQYLLAYPDISAIFVTKNKKITLANITKNHFKLLDKQYQLDSN